MCSKDWVSNWNEYNFNAKMEEYLKEIEITFDEVDDMFFDLARDAIDQSFPTFKQDKECIVAFIKRNDDMEKLYHVDLLTDDQKLKEVVREIIDKFGKDFKGTKFDVMSLI
jgi:hypothetical protein